MSSIENIADILKTDKDIISHLDDWCGQKSGKTRVLDEVIKENQSQMSVSLSALGCQPDASLAGVVSALENKVLSGEAGLQAMFGSVDFMNAGFGNKLLETVIRLVNPRPGLFLKKTKAVEFIRNQPPVNIMRHLGYVSADEMLAKEDIMQI